jgi:hypothetical protein
VKRVPIIIWGGSAINLDNVSHAWYKKMDTGKWQVQLHFIAGGNSLFWTLDTKQEAKDFVQELAQLAEANIIVEEFP